MIRKLGDLKWPFIAAAAAITGLTFGYETSDIDRFNQIDRLWTAMIMSVAFVTVLYAAMRAASVSHKNRLD